MQSWIRNCALSVAAIVGMASVAHAQDTQGEFARVVIIEPKPGQAAAFTAGYGRHLEWHREHQDPWTWRGWTFVLGDRLGQFMDGTFGHELKALDGAIDPRGDAADNAANVVPYANFLSHGIYERLPSASVGPAMPDASPFLVLDTYVVEPGQEAAFEAAMERAAQAGTGRMSLFRMRIGGHGQYLLMRPAETFAGGAALLALPVPAGIVRERRSELLRYDAAMSYVPKAWDASR